MEVKINTEDWSSYNYAVFDTDSEVIIFTETDLLQYPALL